MDILDDDPGESDELPDTRAAIGEILEVLRKKAAPYVEELSLTFNGAKDEYDDVYTLPSGFFARSPMTKLSRVNLVFCVTPSLSSCGLLSKSLTHLYLPKSLKTRVTRGAAPPRRVVSKPSAARGKEYEN